MTAEACIFIAVEICFFLVLVWYTLRKRKKIGLELLYFSIPSFLINFFLNAILINRAAQENGGFSFLSFSKCVLIALDSFGFHIDADVYATAAENAAFEAAYIISILLSSLTLISAFLSLVQRALVNAGSVFINLRFRNADLAVGSDVSTLKTYAKNSREQDDKHVVLWIDANDRRLSSAEKKALYEDGFTVINKPFVFSAAEKYLKLYVRDYHVVCFRHNNGLSPYLDFIKAYRGRTSAVPDFVIESDIGQAAFVHEQVQISKQMNHRERLTVAVFNPYESAAKVFAEHHTLSYYVNRDTDFLQDAALKQDKQINVVMIGMGKTNRALLSTLIQNNQFVGYDDAQGRYVARPVTYYLFDNCASSLKAEPITSLCERFGRWKYADKDVYFDRFEDVAVIGNGTADPDGAVTIEPMNVYSANFIDTLDALTQNENAYTFFVIGLSSSIENASYARNLSLRLRQTKNAVFFYNVDSESEILLSYDNDRLIPYGLKKDTTRHFVLCEEDLLRRAKIINGKYDAGKSRGMTEKEYYFQNYYRKPVYEQLSSVGCALSLKAKLNAIGLDFVREDEDGEPVDEATYAAILSGTIDGNDDSSYFAHNVKCAVTYLEHLRWTAFYLFNGFRPMPIETAAARYRASFLPAGENFQKDYIRKEHACITSYAGLHEYHAFSAKLQNISLSDASTYLYDLIPMLNLFRDGLIPHGMKVVRINGQLTTEADR